MGGVCASRHHGSRRVWGPLRTPSLAPGSCRCSHQGRQPCGAACCSTAPPSHPLVTSPFGAARLRFQQLQLDVHYMRPALRAYAAAHAARSPPCVPAFFALRNRRPTWLRQPVWLPRTQTLALLAGRMWLTACWMRCLLLPATGVLTLSPWRRALCRTFSRLDEAETEDMIGGAGGHCRHPCCTHARSSPS